ncbi:MAG: carboxylesterase family protein [Candidatus Azobacteroides sp.]|nr:carboxylesterase family protein [Candidatus Azobacteroides sp.]
MKTKTFFLFSFLFLGIPVLMAQSFPVTFRIIDYTCGITNDAGNNNSNIIIQIDDVLKAQNPRDPDPTDWWYPLYNNSGIIPDGNLIKSAESWIWETTLNATPGTYQWAPFAKSLGWQPIKNSGLITYDGDAVSFTVSEAGEITGTTYFEIGDAPTFSTEVVLKVLDYSKGKSIQGAGESEEKNIYAWVEQGYCGGWLCPFYDDGGGNGSFARNADHWEWSYRFRTSKAGTFQWNPYIRGAEENISDPEEELKKDVVYASGTALTEAAKQAYNIYLPAGRTKDKTPVVFVIHGGSWQYGDRSDYDFDVLKEYFPGAAIVTVGYRLFSQGYVLFGKRYGDKNYWPTQETDVNDCISHVLNHLDEYNVSDKIALIGESAGSHLAMLWAYKYGTASSADIRSIVNLWGPTDLSSIYHLVDQATRDALDLFLGGNPESNSTVWADASPVTHIADDAPPTLTIHWTEDETVPYLSAGNLKNILDEKGVENRLITHDGNEHGFGNKRFEIESNFSYFINSRFTEHPSVKEMNIPGMEWPATESGHLEYTIDAEGRITGITTLIIPDNISTGVSSGYEDTDSKVTFSGNEVRVQDVVSSVNIYTISGIKIKEVKEPGEVKLNISGLDKGIYFLVVDGKYNYKFVK